MQMYYNKIFALYDLQVNIFCSLICWTHCGMPTAHIVGESVVNYEYPLKHINHKLNDCRNKQA